jgi:DNA-binding response OmpR family regulator
VTAADFNDGSAAAGRAPREESEEAPAAKSTILVVDSDASSLEFVERALTQAGFNVIATTQVGGPQGALGLLDLRTDIHIVVIDPQTCHSTTGTTFKTLHGRYAALRPALQFVLVAPTDGAELAADYLEFDSADFLPKPLTRRILLRAVLEAKRRHDHQQERDNPRATVRPLDRTTGLAKNGSGRDQPLELKILQTLYEIDDFRLRALDGVVEPDASWSMLTELLRARIIRRRISVTSLCLASKSPVTTALRRIERLLETGYITYSLDPRDRRRKYVELTEDGAARVQEVIRGIARHFKVEDTPGPTEPSV